MNTIQKILQTLFYIVTLLLLAGFTAHSQKAIEVKYILAQMSKGSQPGYSVEIPQAKLKTVQYEWIKKLQERNKVKVKEIDQELVLPGAVKSEFSRDTTIIYSILIQKDSIVLLNVFIEFNNVFFRVNDNKADLASEKKDQDIINYIRSFAVDEYRMAVTQELKDEQETLETMQDDLEKLKKDEEDMIKDNSSLENDIDKTEREIAQIENNIELKNQEILNHNLSMQTIVGETEKKAAKEKQKSLEKEKNQMEKSRSNGKDDISSYQSKIEKNNNKIEDGKKLQEEKKEEITAQTKVVNQVQNKLNGIK